MNRYCNICNEKGYRYGESKLYKYDGLVKFIYSDAVCIAVAQICHSSVDEADVSSV